MVEATNYNHTLVERKHGLKRNSQKNSSSRDNNSSWLHPNYALGPATLYWIILTGNKVSNRIRKFILLSKWDTSEIDGTFLNHYDASQSNIRS